MITIKKLNEKNFQITDGEATRTYAALYFAESHNIDRVYIGNISKPKDAIVEAAYSEISIIASPELTTGVIPTSSDEAVLLLNQFIGNFKTPAGADNTGDTIESFETVTVNGNHLLVLKTDKNQLGFEAQLPASPKSGFLIRWNISGLNVTINNGSVYNLTQHLVGVLPALMAGITDSDFPRVNTGVNTLLKFPAIDKLTAYIFDVRLSGSMTSSDKTFTIDIRRSDNTLVKGDTFSKSGVTTLTNETVNIFTYTNGMTDPYTTGGLKLELNNTSNSSLTLTGIELIIDATIKNY